MLQNLDIPSLSEKGMEEVVIMSNCPKCNTPLLYNHNDYGDARWFCLKCRKSFFRYGYNGPLIRGVSLDEMQEM